MQLNFCPHCFADVSDTVCPICNFNKASIQHTDGVLAPGTILNGKYKIGRVLGQGGFGVTYTAFGVNEKKRYAIKEYMPSDIAVRKNDGSLDVSRKDREIYSIGLDKFLDETNVLITLIGTKTIVEAYDFFYANNTGYMVMEFLDGISLDKLLKKKGRLEPEFALNVIVEVSEAMRHVHMKKIYHRDISPDNIFRLNDGTYKVIDFGAAKVFLGEKSQYLTLKPGFAPIEQYSSKGEQGPWTDIYAIAATYYNLVTGNNPQAATDRQACDNMRNLAELCPNIPNHIVNTINKALSINYRDRYKNIDDFLTALLKKQYVPKAEKNDIQPVKVPTKPSIWRRWTQRVLGEYPTEPVKPPSNKIPGPFLRVVKGPVTIAYLKIPRDVEIFVGRESANCQVVVGASEVSRIHCGVKFNSQNGNFTIRDLSSNGTFFSNGQRMQKDVGYYINSNSVVMLAGGFYLEMGVSV